MLSKSVKILMVALLIVAIAACSEHFVRKLSAKDNVEVEQNSNLPPIIKVGNTVGCTIVTKKKDYSIIIPWWSKLKIEKISGDWVYVKRGNETKHHYWIYVPNYIWVQETVKK